MEKIMMNNDFIKMCDNAFEHAKNTFNDAKAAYYQCREELNERREALANDVNKHMSIIDYIKKCIASNPEAASSLKPRLAMELCIKVQIETALKEIDRQIVENDKIMQDAENDMKQAQEMHDMMMS